MAAGTGKVVVVGSFNVDHVWRCATLPKPGETLSGEYHTGPGGKGFNQAIAARRAGADTRLVCALGEDAGAGLARALAEADALQLLAKTSAAPTGTAGIYVDDAGRNSIVIGPGANGDLDTEFVESHAAAIAEAGVLLAQLENPGEAILQALRTARAAGVPTILNPAPANAGTNAAQLAASDVITPNETEFVALVAAHLGQALHADDIGAMADADLHALCRALLPDGSVVVTLGAAGCFVSHPAQTRRGDDADHYRVPAARARAVDTTGAGDAFNGALAASLAAQPAAAFATQVGFATRYAARATEAHGAAEAMPRLTPED